MGADFNPVDELSDLALGAARSLLADLADNCPHGRQIFQCAFCRERVAGRAFETRRTVRLNQDLDDRAHALDWRAAKLLWGSFPREERMRARRLLSKLACATADMPRPLDALLTIVDKLEVSNVG